MSLKVGIVIEHLKEPDGSTDMSRKVSLVTSNTVVTREHAGSTDVSLPAIVATEISRKPAGNTD